MLEDVNEPGPRFDLESISVLAMPFPYLPIILLKGYLLVSHLISIYKYTLL